MDRPPTKPGLLNSWKEIAAYLGRGLRTVQRWEAYKGLPVRRLASGPRAPVIADTGELDAWLSRVSLAGRRTGTMHARRGEEFSPTLRAAVEESRALRKDLAELRSGNRQARAALRESISQLVHNSSRPAPSAAKKPRPARNGSRPSDGRKRNPHKAA